MMQVVQQWLVRNAQATGVLAFMVQYPDLTGATQKCVQEIASEALENAWRCVLETIPVLRLNRFPTGRFRWVYQQGMIHCECRRDGICLGIFTSKDPTMFHPEEVDRLVAEFHAL